MPNSRRKSTRVSKSVDRLVLTTTTESRGSNSSGLSDALQRDMSRIPVAVQEWFGQVGFVKWTNAHCPVLCVNPIEAMQSYHLPAGIYHAWMYKVDTLDESSPCDQLPLLLYWYGTSFEFSVVAVSHFIPYEQGVHYGYDQIPDFIEERMALGRPVPGVYELLQGGMKALLEDLALPTAERVVKNLELAPVNNVVLNEWHALAMDPPQILSTFLQRQAEIMELLPRTIVKTFGQLGFLRFQKKGGSKHMHPVLVLSPFKAPPGPIRSEWFRRYQETPHSYICLIYYLGAFTCGQKSANEGAFSFISYKQFTPYESGVALAYDRIEESIRQAYQKKRTSLAVDWLVCGQWELQQALSRAQQDRWGGLEDFEEDYTDDFDYYLECVRSHRHNLNRQSQSNDMKSSEDEEVRTAMEISTEDSSSRKEEELQPTENIVSSMDDPPDTKYDNDNGNKLQNSAESHGVEETDLDKTVLVVDDSSSGAPFSPESNASSTPPARSKGLIDSDSSVEPENAKLANGHSKPRTRGDGNNLNEGGAKNNGKHTILSNGNRNRPLTKNDASSCKLAIEQDEGGNPTEDEDEHDSNEVNLESPETLKRKQFEDAEEDGADAVPQLAGPATTAAAVPAATQEMDKADSDTEALVADSINACTSVLDKETTRVQKQLKKRKKDCGKKRLGPVGSIDDNLRKKLRNSDNSIDPSCFASVPSSVEANDRLSELKRRKEETQQVLNKVIEDYIRPKTKK